MLGIFTKIKQEYERTIHMKVKLAMFAIALMICSLIAVPVSAKQASDLNCGNCQAQSGQTEEKKGCCGENKKACDGEKKQECDGQKKEECNKDKQAEQQAPAEE